MTAALPPTRGADDLQPDPYNKLTPLQRYTRFLLGHLTYLHRPVLWPAMGRKLRDSLFARKPSPAELEQMRKEGEAWCAQRQIGTREALQRLGIAELVDVTAKFPDIFAAAEMRAGKLPVWFGADSNLNLLYTLCLHYRPAMLVETGVGHGWSSLTFLLYLRERITGRLISSDMPVMTLRNDGWVGAAVPEELRAHWSIFRMADREALPKICGYAYPIDFVYYDSDRDMAARRFAYALLWRNLKSGGVMVSDDVDDNLAFAKFCEKISAEPIIIKEPGSNAQGILIKP